MTASIIIPTYNQAWSFLEAAVKSALLQTVPVEVIVVDDGSVEPVEHRLYNLDDEVAGRAEQGDFSVIRQDNGGVASALNAGIKAAKGEYVQWLSSDDLFSVQKTLVQAEAMIAGDAKVSYCAYEEGIPQTGATWPAAQYPSREDFFAVLKQHCFVNACTVMWHRSVFDEIGYFDPNMWHCQDYEFLLRCAEKWNFLAVNVPLVRRRVHPGQMLNTLKKPEEAEHKAQELAYLHEQYGATAQVWVPT